MEEEGIFYFFKQERQQTHAGAGERRRRVRGLSAQAEGAVHCRPLAGAWRGHGGSARTRVPGAHRHSIAHRLRFRKAEYQPDGHLWRQRMPEGEYLRLSGQVQDQGGGRPLRADPAGGARESISRRSAAPSNCMGFECGYKFTLDEHFRDISIRPTRCMALEHRGRTPATGRAHRGAVPVHQSLRGHSQPRCRSARRASRRKPVDSRARRRRWWWASPARRSGPTSTAA